VAAVLGPQVWRLVRQAIALLVLGAVALVIALAVTPPVQVATFGQIVEVGAVVPSVRLGISGPGQADLFGEGPVSTVQQFDGPIRPRIVWKSFNRNDAAGQFIQSTSDNGTRTLQTGSAEVGAQLAQGWLTYFVRLIVVAAAIGAALYLVVLGGIAIARPEQLHGKRARRQLLLLGLSVVAAVIVTVGSAALTLLSARSQLSNISTLADLTGTARLVPAPAAIGPPRSGVDVVVIGDSTAAGVGNTPLADPTPLDQTCGRSSDAYAVVLQSATGLKVTNLACSSATLTRGVFGPQIEGKVTVPPQLGVLKSITSVRAVIVSVGANDMGWSDFLQYCYGLTRCDDQASDSLFQSRLDAFRLQYAQLLQQLAALPSHPEVIVTGYYDPFGDTFDCPALQDPGSAAGQPAGFGFAADPGRDNQAEKVAQKIDPLRSELTQMNAVLQEGADAFGFTSVVPHFDGHALCSVQPWVQGLSARYPFHPNAAGELAIAAAQLSHLAAIAAG
jgi:lysophospholipase L1-like esterase